jgi:hypothetical protein
LHRLFGLSGFPITQNLSQIYGEKARCPIASASRLTERNMRIVLRAIETIRPYEQNPRLNDAAVDAVAASIREFGFR